MMSGVFDTRLSDCLLRPFALPEQGVELPEVSSNPSCSVVLWNPVGSCYLHLVLSK